MKNANYFLCLFLLLVVLSHLVFSTATPCTSSKNSTKCSYRISRLDENEYLMVKNILNNLLTRHWNITLEYLFFKPESGEYKVCDQYFGINCAILKLLLK